MTTIAVKNGLMVADSKTSTGDCWWPSTKVHRLPGVLIGGAGDPAAVRQFVEWYADGHRLPKPVFSDDEFCALELSAEGLFYWASNLNPVQIERGFHAIGSGGSAALGALMAGTTAQKAVQIACEIDTGSGGDVVVHRLKA